MLCSSKFVVIGPKGIVSYRTHRVVIFYLLESLLYPNPLLFSFCIHVESQRKKTYLHFLHLHVRPAKIQISLRIRAVWSESSLGAFWIVKEAKFLHADDEDSDQTAHPAQADLSLRWALYQKVRFLTLGLISVYWSCSLMFYFECAGMSGMFRNDSGLALINCG